MANAELQNEVRAHRGYRIPRYHQVQHTDSDMRTRTRFAHDAVVTDVRTANSRALMTSRTKPPLFDTSVVRASEMYMVVVEEA
jgi:hypothetical protein